jgi:signal transduction histidine kinase
VDVADLRAIALFDGLSDGQVRELIAIGEELRFTPGQVLFREAQPADHWWVLPAGTIRLVRHVGAEETLLAVMKPGQWAGGFRAWDAQGVHLATGRGATDGRVLRVPSELLRDRAEAWFPFGVHLILGLANTVRRIESVARQRESLVALGTLAAGMAHEINNPASAAMRAVDALTDISEGLLSSLERLADSSMSAAQLRELDRLRREIDPIPTSLGPLEVADREDALSEWLASHGVERD